MNPAAYEHLHRDAVARLTAWVAPDAAQEALRVAYLAHLAAHPDAMAKAGPPEHLTGSALVLDASRERVLLTLHRKAGQWLQFGGHFEAEDATMWDGARREAAEESGLAALDVRPQIVELHRHTLGSEFGRCRAHLDVRYVAVAADDALPVTSEESLDVQWWPIAALPGNSVDDLPVLVAAAQRVLGG